MRLFSWEAEKAPVVVGEITCTYLLQVRLQRQPTRLVSLVMCHNQNSCSWVQYCWAKVQPNYNCHNVYSIVCLLPCYRTWSMGAFVDKSAGKLKRVDDATIASMNLEPKLEMNYKDRRIILPKEESVGETCDPVRVQRADIDYNRHVNNANYIRMAMELLPEDFWVKGLRVEYRVAAKLGDVLLPTVYRIDNGIIVSLSIGNEVSAIVEFE